MYPVLKDMVTRCTENEIGSTRDAIHTETCGSALSNYFMKSLMTPVARRMIEASDKTASIPDVAISKMLHRETAKVRKVMMSRLKRLDDVGQTEAPDIISVSVEWHRGRYGEYNASATVRANGIVTYGSATGCGYDKESASIAYAMNKNEAVLRVWYDHAELGGKFEYSMLFDERSPLPHMDGGCGMGAVRSVFEALGYSVTSNHGKSFDYYEFRKEK